MERKINVLYLRPGDEEPREFYVSNDYKTFKALLDDGYIESVTIPQLNCVLLLDEEGKRKELPFNNHAQLYFGPYLNRDDWIVGPVIVTGPIDGDFELTSLKPLTPIEEEDE